MDDILDIITISKQIKQLTRQRRYQEALELCTNDICSTNLIILSQKISILMKQGKYQEALELCNQDICETDLPILSQKITILTQLEKYEEALKICDLELCREHFPIVSQKVTILMQQNRYEEALKICNSENYSTFLPILSQKITILTQQNRYEEALNVCNLEICRTCLPIVSQKITILTQLGRYKEALNECTETRCKQEYTFSIYKTKLQDKLKDSMLQQKNSMVSDFLTRIYTNDINVEEFSQLQDYSWEQLILLIAYYEKNNVKLGLQLIKERLPQYENDIPKKKVLNQLKIRLSSKKLKMHYITIYSNILCTQIDADLALEIMQKQQDQETPVVMKSEPDPCLPISKPMTKEKSKKSSHMIAVTGVKNNRYTQSSTSYSSIKLSNTSVQDVHIKDVFQEEFLEIEKYLYCAMQQTKTQRKAIQAWDILEQIGENSIYNKRSFHQMVNLLYRLCGTIEVPSSISISIDSEKVKTLQQKYNI